jgi:ribose 5-phosphate isomerase B
MIIYIGADHGGFNLKKQIAESLKGEGYQVEDMGAAGVIADDDYPDYAAAVARKVAENPLEARGIVICRSGFGVDIVANKFDGIRSALAMTPDQAYQGRHDDDVNVLALAADFIEESVAIKTASVFLKTPFAKEDKYARRLEKIGKIEATN